MFATIFSLETMPSERYWVHLDFRFGLLNAPKSSLLEEMIYSKAKAGNEQGQSRIFYM